MSQNAFIGSLFGKWTYRSFLSDADLSPQFNDLEFGRGTIAILEAPMGVLNGSINYGDPHSMQFQGKGVIGGEEWIYDYAGYVIKPWPNGVNQVPAMVGSIVRTVPHSSGTAPAGVVCTWIAVWQGPL